MKGFKDFLMRGNVIDLAVAVIIGAAFTAIVDGLVDGIFNPLIALMANTENIEGAYITIGDGTQLMYGLVIGAVIKFILIAAVVYFILVLPMNKMKEQAYIRQHGHPESEAEKEISDLDLLTEIRDLLKAQQLPRQ